LLLEFIIWIISKTIKVVFLYFYLCLSVMVDNIYHVHLHPQPFFLITFPLYKKCISFLFFFFHCQLSGPTTYFWYRETLNIAPSINSESIMNWKLVLALLAAWIVVFMCMVKGIKSSGKVSIHTSWISNLLSDGHYSTIAHNINLGIWKG